MCRLLPGMPALKIETLGMDFDLSPVSALSRLVKVDLYNSRRGLISRADLESLPASLQKLHINGFHLRDVHLQHLKCVNLKELECKITEETFDDTYRLLEALPSLKVFELGRKVVTPLSIDLQAIFGFTGLTKLSLNVGWLKAPLIKPVGVAALKQLSLRSIAISEPWLQYIYQLPCLETLYLFHCREDGPFHHTALTLASPTRSLILCNVSPNFLPSVSPQQGALQSLKYNPREHHRQVGEREVSAIARFSGLTALTLENFDSSAGFQTVSSLGLQELTLVHCPGAELKLFLPCRFSTLRKVKIEEWMWELQTFRAKPDENNPAAQQKAEQLAQAASNLLSVPSLSFLSGCCKLFMLARLGEQEGWSRSPSPSYHHFQCNSHASMNWHCFDCLHRYQEWSKTM